MNGLKKGAHGSRRMALAVSDGVASRRRTHGFDESRQEEAEDMASEKSDESLSTCTIIPTQCSPIPTVSTAHYHHSRNAGTLAKCFLVFTSCQTTRRCPTEDVGSGERSGQDGLKRRRRAK